MTVRANSDRGRKSRFRRVGLLCRVMTAALLASSSALAQHPAQAPAHAQHAHVQHEDAVDIAIAKASQSIDAFFVRSDVDLARTSASDALQLFADSKVKRPKVTRRFVPQAEFDALFVQMEAAALQADTRAELDAALRLCELRSATGSNEALIGIAAARIRGLGANTADFRAAVPRIRALLARDSAVSNDLRAALLAAATDGAPGLSLADLVRETGVVTDWRIAGPFGHYPNVAFERAWDPERDGMTRPSYGGRFVEQFRFDDGKVTVPEYFPDDGVFYAASKISVATPGDWTLHIESPGTIQAWIDGNAVLTKDDRFHSTPENAEAVVPLRAGAHQLLVKFLSSASPFRVALVPSSLRRALAQSPANTASTAESEYVNASESFWSGDYAEAIRQLTRLRATRESAAIDFLLAQAWSHSGDSIPERKPLLQAALKAAPSAHAAEYELASIAFSQQRFDEALEAARRVLAAEPRFEPAARLIGTSASRLGRPADAAKAFEAAVALHPSCAVLKQAGSFFAGISDYAQARKYESQLEHCAPASLAWAEALSSQGRHAESAAAARQLAAEHPLDRAARALLVRELSLAGNTGEARMAAHQLAGIAPNSAQFRRLASTLDAGEQPLDSASANSAFADQQQFYSPYRRDGIEVVKQTSSRNFSGGVAVFLLRDRVAQVRPGGAAALYVHELTRVLNRDGISQYGEVAVPNDANLLELRTIKPDGTVVEPEFNERKSTVSMPALAPGDAIDLEYVIPDLEGGVADHPDAFHFTFGSFAAPTILSRFILISPDDTTPDAVKRDATKLKFVPFGDIPVVTVAINDGAVTRSWQANDVPQSVSEISMPRTGVLPSIRVFAAEDDGWAGIRDFYRDEFIDATHIGSRVESVARELSQHRVPHPSPSGEGALDRLRAAFRFVTSRIRLGDAAYDSGHIPSAETTFTTYEGSRTAALLALAREMKIPGRVLMARDVSPQPPEVPSPYGYTHPLLAFRVNSSGTQREIVLDAETEGLGFGGINAKVERKDALQVALDLPSGMPLIVPVPAPLANEHSTAEGDVSFDSAGGLTAHIVIRMGEARGAQMRTTLGGIEPQDRKRFFEQLAARIFPGVTYASGEVQNESDTDAPLILILDCRATHVADFSETPTELDQLVPTLGLKSMYATASLRRTPLLIDTPLFETSTFRLHLPDGMRFTSPPPDMTRTSDFGSYSVTFEQTGAQTIEVRRDFDIPVQIVETDRFSSFGRFAQDIDDAERQHLPLQHSGAPDGARSPQPGHD